MVLSLPRGHHVKLDKGIQEHARRGQEHWQKKVLEMRQIWETAGMSALYPLVRKQIVEQKAKPQKECILLFLHLALHRGQICFSHWDVKCVASYGWKKFRVNPSCAIEFAAGMRQMFPLNTKQNTYNNSMRRLGLSPFVERSWCAAWSGQASFYSVAG
eukprot:3320997-Rhodomonas_salina.1